MLTGLSVSHLDQVNPPGNVTAEMEGTRLSVRWEKPVSAFPNHCWTYEVKIYSTRKGYVQVILPSPPDAMTALSQNPLQVVGRDRSAHSSELTRSEKTYLHRALWK